MQILNLFFLLFLKRFTLKASMLRNRDKASSGNS